MGQGRALTATAMNGSSENLALAGYALAGLAYFAVLTLSLVRSAQRSAQLSLYIALTAGGLWSAMLAFAALDSSMSASTIFYVELTHDAAWLLCLSSMFAGAVGLRSWTLLRFGGVAIAVLVMLVGAALDTLWSLGRGDSGSAQLLVIASIFCSLYALYLLEQTYRNGRDAQRHGLRFICLGIGGIFAYDLFLFTNTILAGDIDDNLWNARGFVVAGCLLVLAVGLLRTEGAVARIFVSRKVVAYSATLLATGIYFVVVGIIGYYLKSVGGQWGATFQVAGLFLATLLLVLFLFSRRLRARFNVFVSKHFFESKYDYRAEWLRLMRTLNEEDDLPLRKRCIAALAQIVDAGEGWLWLRDGESRHFECVSGWNTAADKSGMELGEPVIDLMEQRNWIIVPHEAAPSEPDGAADIEHPFDEDEQAGLVIPLIINGRMLGFVVSGRSTSVAGLDYEDIDVLKTAAQQVASYVAQDIATEGLAESRQFEAVNRLTTFLMHDLKNLVAQQSMIVDNAQRHRRNPEFVDDMVETIANSVGRMKRLLRQLGRADGSAEVKKISLRYPASHAIDRCAGREPAPDFRTEGDEVFVTADPEQLSTVLQHLIRNAQDATAADGRITVTIRNGGNGTGRIEVADTGTGMSEDFVRERLFKPFDSTKGARGMGVGVYQAREFVRSMGGELRVRSRLEVGTTVVVELPVTSVSGST